ncbi:MAG TPA: hypothetical protein VJQ57_09205 [Acidimicrobiia bacterium]|nr:hypothetical protein [Acidimicrobiia bacterium]
MRTGRIVSAGSSAVPVVAQGPPWVLAAILFDGDSLQLSQFARDRLRLFDKAWGQAVYGWPVGNPLERGEVCERLGGPELLRRGEAKAVIYKKLAESRGSEMNHVLREVEELRAYYGVDRSRLPAFIFRTFPSRPECLVLPVDRRWLASEESRLAFSSALQECLAEERVLGLITPGETTTYELEQGFGRLLNEIPARMRRFSSGPATSSQGPTRRSMIADKAARTDNLVIDTAAHRVLYRRKELRFSAFLFDVNLILAKKALQGRSWVERAHLEEILWPKQAENYEVPSYKINDVMRRLRGAYVKAPGMNPAKVRQLFPMQRHLGYRMEIPSEKIVIL